MSKNKNILFLYTELSGYFIACLNELASANTISIHVIHWPLNKEAQFKFNLDITDIKYYNKGDYKFDKLTNIIEVINPDLIICSGWVDKDYKKICKYYRKLNPVVLAFDNQWRGNFKQRIASVCNKLLIQPYYSHAWVPGVRQEVFVNKLGFPNKNILHNCYSCDVPFFTSLGKKYEKTKREHFPKRFLFVGRYIKEKGIQQLWQSMKELVAETGTKWELWCIGSGTLEQNKIQHQNIKHFGFVQASDIERFIAECGVFILPSSFEPWGVALHEFAAAGFPLIATNEVGASTAFLTENNGLLLKNNSVDEIKSALIKIINNRDEELMVMGQKSMQLAQKITPKTWAQQIVTLLNKN